MIIERSVAKYVVFAEDSLLTALQRISDNRSRIVFAVTESGILEGVLTDGDFRRWLVGQKSIDLNQPVSEAMNRTFVACRDQEEPEKVQALLSERIAFIPLLDRSGRLTAVASRKTATLRIGEHTIDEESPAFLIAEIGNNHNGSVELARRLVDEAINAGANCAKFQLRSLSTLYRNAGNASDASEDLGSQYTLDLLSRFQLPDEDLCSVFDYCRERGITPMCTPWDTASLATLERYGMRAYKIASADLTNHDLLEATAATHKPMIVSTGMSTESEILDAVRVLKRASAQYALLHCNSTYPAPFKDLHLNYIERLRQIGECPVGYSGHERGYSVAIAAVAKGAKIIEKHFTLDRTMEGNDHRVSLLPGEFGAMVQAIREVEQSLGERNGRRLTQGELMNREVLGKSLVCVRPIQAGEPITADAVDVRSPGRGLSPYRKQELIGKIAIRDILAGDFFYPSDIEDRRTRPRDYRFSRPFGIPVRYHDFAKLTGRSNLNLVEFHLSYKDLDEDPARFIEAESNLQLAVHSPELFANDHILDLASSDDAYRRNSIRQLQRVIDITRSLKARFPKTARPMIVINAGGFSADSVIPASARAPLYDRVAESVTALDAKGVEIILQTMPPFPWHFGGQRFHNLFTEADDIAAFCSRFGIRVCLDISHSKLSCSHLKHSFKEFLEKVGPHAAHLHIVDAAGVDGEGLQIGEGDVDFALVADVLNRTAPKASFIPEIWQGHKDDGAGFWEALDKLERWF